LTEFLSLSLFRVANLKNLNHPLNACVKSPINKKAEQCQYLGTNGQLCGERKFIQIHQLEPLWQGGRDGVDNLLSLCLLQLARQRFR